MKVALDIEICVTARETEVPPFAFDFRLSQHFDGASRLTKELKVATLCPCAAAGECMRRKSDQTLLWQEGLAFDYKWASVGLGVLGLGFSGLDVFRAASRFAFLPSQRSLFHQCQ